eukprot:COSAG02_NODE_25340_length_661_cov_1.195730_1_plen_103_part_10
MLKAGRQSIERSRWRLVHWFDWWSGFVRLASSLLQGHAATARPRPVTNGLRRGRRIAAGVHVPEVGEQQACDVNKRASTLNRRSHAQEGRGEGRSEGQEGQTG